MTPTELLATIARRDFPRARFVTFNNGEFVVDSVDGRARLWASETHDVPWANALGIDGDRNSDWVWTLWLKWEKDAPMFDENVKAGIKFARHNLQLKDNEPNEEAMAMLEELAAQ